MEGASAPSEGGQVTRGHFARFWLMKGMWHRSIKVFKRYLAKGKTEVMYRHNGAQLVTLSRLFIKRVELRYWHILVAMVYPLNG